jgi:uncharacterized YccA/Bax inhibitor family protein
MIIVIRLLILVILAMDALVSWGLIEHGNGLSSTASLEWTGIAGGLALAILLRTFGHK